VSPALRLPPIGSIVAVWWDDPAMDLEVWAPGDAALHTCPKVTVGVLLSKNRRDLVLSHEAYLDGSAQQWVRTIILRRLVTRIESIPGISVPLKPS
jgi:hypothetical protein